MSDNRVAVVAAVVGAVLVLALVLTAPWVIALVVVVVALMVVTRRGITVNHTHTHHLGEQEHTTTTHTRYTLTGGRS